jgi:NAD(P)-dependent dehydrogenase (short-subunit alcohol dehydrogenase family)
VPAPAIARPVGVPLSKFDERCTAEHVTRGHDLAGKTMLVTGVTSGIGFETLRVLALRGAHVIGTARTLERARAACSSVSGRTTAIAMELTDYASVVAAARAVQSLGCPLDALICNAGVMGLRTLERVEGIEKQFATNHLGHFLLAVHLLGPIMAAPQGRIIVVSSGVLVWTRPNGIDWDNLSGERSYDPRRAYAQSKLANALFALELARRLNGTRATANVLHPGYVDTPLFRHFPLSLTGFRGILTARKKIPVPRGAATTCYLATAPELAQVSGHFFMACNPVVADPLARDTDMAARLWTVSEQLVRPYLDA